MTKEDKKPGRITDYNKKLPVLEVYTCIQSEGSKYYIKKGPNFEDFVRGELTAL